MRAILAPVLLALLAVQRGSLALVQPLVVFDPAFPSYLLDPGAASAGIARPMPDNFTSGFLECYQDYTMGSDVAAALGTVHGPLPSLGLRTSALGACHCLPNITQPVAFVAHLLGPAAADGAAASRPAPAEAAAEATVEGLHFPAPGATQDLVAQLLGPRGAGKLVILHVFQLAGYLQGGGDREYQRMLLSWAAHAARVGALRRTLLVGLTQGDCEFGRRVAPCLVHDQEATGLHVNRTSSPDVKWYYSSLLLKAGYAVVQMDVDAYFLGDALDALMASPTLVSGLSDRQLDGQAPEKGPKAFISYCDPPEAACQSTGFMFMRPHQIVVDEVDTYLAALQTTAVWEQDLWQPSAERLRALNRQGWNPVAGDPEADDVYRILPMVGEAAFANWGPFWQALRQGNVTAVPLLLHMGGRGHGDKERIFRCGQMWFHEEAVFCGAASWPKACSERALAAGGGALQSGAEGDGGDVVEAAAARAQQSAAAAATLREHFHAHAEST